MPPMILRMTDANTPVVADMPRLADCWTKKPTFASFSGLRK